MKFIDKLILFTFPFMEVGFIVYGIPFRLGELSFFLFFFRIIDLNSFSRVKKVSKNGLLILFLLIINLILTVIVTLFSNVDDVFYMKYVLRNILYVLAILTFIIKPIKFDQIEFSFFIKYILYVVVIFYIIECINFYIFYVGWEDVFVDRQNKNVFYDFLIRFAGPSSEPAYVVPLLAIPIMYGFLNKKLKYSLLSIFLILLTFSSFGYAVIIFSGIFFFKNIANKQMLIKAKKILIKGIVFLLFICLLFFNKVVLIVSYNWAKIQAYFGIGDVFEWSASQRSGHINLALDLFGESSWYRMLIGNGTGYYSKQSKEFVKFYLDDAEEAHSLYVSTLTDRGLIGLLIIILLFYIISKIRLPVGIQGDYKYFFIAVKFGVLVRMFHWFFTGMLWQYYFWVEVVLLLSMSSYFIKISNDKEKV